MPRLQLTRTVPIVFPIAADPVGAGLVDSLARPGGNVTGFMTTEYSFGGKWLELLKQVAPGVTRVAVLRDATQGGGTSQSAVIQAMAPSLGVEVSLINLRDAPEIERAISAFARSPNGGLIIVPGASGVVHHDLIIALAAQHRLPAVYPLRFFVAGGGLISYGTDYIDQYRRAASYVDRILKGEKVADLPVQAPTKYELVINLKTAQGARLNSATDAARHRGRSDRVTVLFCCTCSRRLLARSDGLPRVTIRSLSEAQRTCRELVRRVDPTLLTPVRTSGRRSACVMGPIQPALTARARTRPERRRGP